MYLGISNLAWLRGSLLFYYEFACIYDIFGFMPSFILVDTRKMDL